MMLLIGLSLSKSATGESLFDHRDYVSLTSDVKAVRVGDKLTVLVRESTSAISSADTSTSKESDFNAGVKYLSLPDHNDRTNIGLGIDRSATGKGKTARAGKIVAEITVIVNAVEPNGDVWVVGEKTVAINDESQLVRVEGGVRKQDILSGNFVESNRLANVKIKIAGEGDLTDSQKQGWLTKLFDWLRIF